MSWLGVAAAVLEMGLCPEIWTGSNAIGHLSMASREFRKCQLGKERNKLKTQQERGFVWHSRCCS